MTNAAPKLYIHQLTGQLKSLCKSEAKKLGDGWTQIEHTKNEEGVPVMRLHLKGATVDISENDPTAHIPEAEIIDGK